MFIKTQEQNIKGTPEPTVNKDESKKLADALSLYLQSIQTNEAQPEWIYGNSITLSAQINRFDVGIQLKEKAERLYPESEEIARAIALLYDRQDRLDLAIEFYQKSVNLNPLQPEWVYTKIYNYLLQNNLIGRANNIRQQGLKYFPQSSAFQTYSTAKASNIDSEINTRSVPVINNLTTREVPQSIEHNVDLDVSKIRRQLMDSSIVENYEILLEQILCDGDSSKNKIDNNALIHCLAQIKTDIHYLKTKLFDPTAASVDPQAKQNVDIEQIVNSSTAIPIRCELRNRIVGSGWHSSEQHGRWTGPSTFSSVVLPYPAAGKYRLEIVIKGEAKTGLLNTLQINVNDRLLSISTGQESVPFPTVICSEVEIVANNKPFLSVDLTIDETVNPQTADTRLLGLLVESISLIPIE